MKHKIAYYGDPVLRQKTKPITQFDESLKKLVEDMVETMETNNGMGLAAPQIFLSIAIMITRVPKTGPNNEMVEGDLRVFINPKILSHSDEGWIHDEACISLPGLRGDVGRPLRIQVEYQDIEGNKHSEELYGWDARVFMHENDHLNGVLYIDRMNPKERKEFDNALREIKKKYSSFKS